MRILRWLATHLPIVRAIDEMYSPYIFFTFQSTEMSTQRLTQEIQDACDRTNVILHKILCYRQDHGYKCKVRLIGEDKKDLFRAFIKVSQSNHIYETRVHLKRRFKVRIGLLFLFTILMWTIFLVFLPSFIRVSPLFAYVEIIPPIIINIFLYNFCLHYFSSLRYNKAILILVTVLNILAVLIYTVIVLNT